MARRNRDPLYPGHQVQLLEGGEQLFPAMRHAFEAAEREIRIETYILHLRPPVGEALADMIEALLEAAKRGVAVYLLADGFGTPEVPHELARRFDAAGVQWRLYKPVGTFGVMARRQWRRLHRKLCVVDGAVAFCGGINLLDDNDDPNHGQLAAPRLDYAVQITGPLVRRARAAMLDSWRHAGGKVLRRRRKAMEAAGEDAVFISSDPLSTFPVSSSARAALLLRDNIRHRRRIELAYIRAIDAAQEEIIIANAYFVPGRPLKRALIAAAQRGVRVRLLLQGRYEYFLQLHAARSMYGPLLAAGIEIHEYEPSFLHAKVAVVDAASPEGWATVGSSNLDPLSLLLAREANIAVNDEAFTTSLRSRLVEIIDTQSRRVDAAAHARRPLRERLLDALANGLMRMALFFVGRKY